MLAKSEKEVWKELSKVYYTYVHDENKQKIVNVKVIEILIDVIRFLARQGIALRVHENEKDGNFELLVI